MEDSLVKFIFSRHCSKQALESFSQNIKPSLYFYPIFGKGVAWFKFIIIIIIIIIIILGISFMQGIYTYIPETNHDPREYCVATILM